MKRSESIAVIAKALAQAQGEMKAAKKDKQNPYYHSTYADLASVIEALREPFAKYGLSYSQGTIPSEKNEIEVITLLMHESGEWLESALTMPVKKDDAQGYGIAMTYARRYALQAIAGQAAEDDDGNASQNTSPVNEKPLKTVAKKEQESKSQEQGPPKPGVDAPWYNAMFKEGTRSQNPQEHPHRVTLEIQNQDPKKNKDVIFSFFSRPEVLKTQDDWGYFVNMPCRFQARKDTGKDGTTYNTLLNLSFDLVND